jgi:CzcA family heavy metal efflux pump
VLDAIIRGSLRHRLLVLSLAAVLLVAGGWATLRAPVDVFPDLTAPTVTILTEARGMAPEEVELLVTFPLESSLNGAPGVRRIRSVSGAALSVVWVEFEWGAEIYRARQVVAERLQTVELPDQVARPQLGPISSIMGEITFLALTSDTVPPMELRRIAETVVRRSLLAVPGISQVVPIGGDVKQIAVVLDPGLLALHRVGVDEVAAALRAASDSPAAGFHVEGGQEYLVRGLSRARTAEELAAAVVRVDEGVPLTVGRLGEVRVEAEPKRGTASYGARPAVILSVQKQPDANTLDLTRAIDRRMEELERSLPKGVKVERENFRQADFIRVAIGNVSAALRDGAVLVVLVLVAFLGNVRTTLISAIALPLSLLAGILAVSALGATVNTMTLGGLAIAIGALVDDAIIDVENVFRRLRENAARPEAERRGALDVVFRASSEVRGAILFATLVILLAFVPLFFLPGIEGRLLRPLGLAYVTALAASLVVSLTVTPVLCSYLLPRSKALEQEETWLLRKLHAFYRPTLEWALARRRIVIVVSVVLALGAAAVLPFLGRAFLPPFNEGALTVALAAAPGITLEDSDRIGRQVEEALLSFPEVVSTSRRTGRAERDEHVQGVNGAEIEVVLKPGRPKEEMLEAMRRAVASIPGVNVTFGQPISHRIDHMVSGSKSNLAVKLHGPDLSVLRKLAAAAQATLGDVPGIVDVSNQEQAAVPQLLVEPDRAALARHGIPATSFARTVEALFQGTEAGQIVDRGLPTRVVVRFPEGLRSDAEALGRLPVPAGGGELVRLSDVARVRSDLGPAIVRREDVERVAVVTANVAGVDLAGTVERAREALVAAVALPEGYRMDLGGQFEAAAESARLLVLLSLLALAGIYGLLYLSFRSHRHTAIVLVNLPLALIGGVFAVAAGGGVLSIATAVGFFTLFGVATRNGVLLVSRYEQLLAEGVSLREAVSRGSEERMAPVLMTALTAALALVPLVLASGKPGNEINSPMAQVILGGLLTSTFLNLVLVPVLFAGTRLVEPKEDGLP